MSGYFSRIARGGGARFSGEGVRRSATKASPTRRPAPIDSEDTVMVSPPEPVRTHVTEASTKSKAAEVIPKETRRGKSGDRTKPVTRLPETRRPSKTRAVITPDPVAEDMRPIPPPDEQHAEVRSETRAVESPRNLNANPPSTADKHRPEADFTDPRQTEGVRPEPSKKRFFENTVAIVEGQSAEPAEAQTILIREVQEWIAAGHIPSTEIVPDDFDEAPLPNRREKPEANEREPGVVRIVDRDRPDVLIDTEQRTSPPPSIEEQNLEVSIGSITVVVEGDDTSPQPDRPTVTRSALAQEPTRRASRLSRHYL